MHSQNSKLSHEPMKRSASILLSLAFLVVEVSQAQQPQPPGIPEPGIALYGLILAADGVQTVPAQSVSLRVSKEGGTPIVANGEVYRGKDGRWRYLAQIPFETVLPGLADTPAQNFNQDQTTDDTYGLFFPNTPNNAVAYNGQTSNVGAVDGNGSVSTFSFGAKEVRGLMVRMDIRTLFDITGLPTYEQWAAGIFGAASGNGARAADPDGDGLNNEFEWIAGLDPLNLDPDSPLNKLVIDIQTIQGQGSQKRITFRPKVAGRVYTVEKRTDIESGAWIAVPASTATTDTPLPAAPEASESQIVDSSAAGDKGFYRLKIELP